MRFKRDKNIMSVDLHGTSAENAKDLLLGWLSNAPSSVTELRVIHGNNHGTILKDMVWQELTHSRISAKLHSLNPGETRIILK